MATDAGSPIAKAYVLLVPSLEGSQSEITTQLTGVANNAAESAGKESGATFGNNLASGIAAASATIAAAVAAATAAAIAVGKEFVQAATDTATYGDTVDKVSQKLGISKKSYQELDYVMQLCGTSIESNQAGFKTLNNKIADAASGSADAAAMFEGLGVSMEDLQNLSTEDIFLKTIEGLQQMPEGAERAALAVDLFGKSGQNLAPLLNMSNEEMQDAIDLANEYGMVMDDEAIEASADYIDALTTMKKTFTGLKNSLMTQFLPSMTEVMEGLAAIFAGDEGGIQMVQEGIQGIIDNIASVSPQLFQLVTVIVNALIAGFGPMLPSLVSAIFSFINQALSTIVSLIPQLTPVLTQGIQGVCSALLTALPLLVKALTDMVKELVLWLNGNNNIKTLVDGLISLVSVLSTSLADMLPIVLPAIVEIIGGVATELMTPQNVNTILNAVLYIVGAVVMALVASLPSIGKVIVDYATNIYNNIMYWGGIIMNWLSPFMSNIFNTVAGWGSNIVSSVYGTFVNVVNTCYSWGSNIANYISGLIWGIQSAIGDFLWNIYINFWNGFVNIQNTIGSFVGGIIGNIMDFCNNVYNTIAALPGQMASIGENLVKGLWNGISDKVDWVINKIKGMGSQIENAIKQQFGIASPSKVFAKIGDFLAQGLGVGFEDGMGDVQDDMINQMDGLTGSMTAEVNAYGSGSASMLGTSNTYNGGNISINVYGAEGQDVNSLADAIAIRLEDMTTRRSAVYG